MKYAYFVNLAEKVIPEASKKKKRFWIKEMFRLNKHVTDPRKLIRFPFQAVTIEERRERIIEKEIKANPEMKEYYQRYLDTMNFGQMKTSKIEIAVHNGNTVL